MAFFGGCAVDSVEQLGDAVVLIKAAPSLDTRLSRALGAAISRHRPAAIVLDLENVHDLDASGVEALADSLTIATLKRITCVLVGARPAVRGHLTRTGALSSMTFAPDVAAARALLRRWSRGAVTGR